MLCFVLSCLVRDGTEQNRTGKGSFNEASMGASTKPPIHSLHHLHDVRHSLSRSLTDDAKRRRNEDDRVWFGEAVQYGRNRTAAKARISLDPEKGFSGGREGFSGIRTSPGDIDVAKRGEGLKTKR